MSSSGCIRFHAQQLRLENLVIVPEQASGTGAAISESKVRTHTHGITASLSGGLASYTKE